MCAYHCAAFLLVRLLVHLFCCSVVFCFSLMFLHACILPTIPWYVRMVGMVWFGLGIGGGWVGWVRGGKVGWMDIWRSENSLI